jgi:hypothetical protein
LFASLGRGDSPNTMMDDDNDDNNKLRRDSFLSLCSEVEVVVCLDLALFVPPEVTHVHPALERVRCRIADFPADRQNSRPQIPSLKSLTIFEQVSSTTVL